MKKLINSLLFSLISISSVQCMDRIEESINSLTINQIETRLEEINSVVRSRFTDLNINLNEEEFLFETLIYSIDREYWNVVQYLLNNNENINVNAIYDNYINPLNFALEKNAPIEVIRQLVENGADVNYLPFENPYHNCPPLGEAISKNINYEITQYLIERDARVDFQFDPSGETYIDYALMYDDPNGQKNLYLLLFNDANLNLSYIDPIETAITTNKNIFVIELLLHCGARVFSDNFELISDYSWEFYNKYYRNEYLHDLLTVCIEENFERSDIDISYISLYLDYLDENGYYLPD